MDDVIKELIAIGASVAAHCRPCLDWHLEKARGFGASEEDIRAAVQVGFMVEEGAGRSMRKYALGPEIQGSEPGKEEGSVE